MTVATWSAAAMSFAMAIAIFIAGHDVDGHRVVACTFTGQGYSATYMPDPATFDPLAPRQWGKPEAGCIS